MTIDQWIRDTAERVAATFVASAITWLLAAQAFGANWVEALVVATVPPILAAVMTAIPGLVYTGPVWWIDALVRAVRQAVQAACSVLLAAESGVADLSVWRGAAITGGMAALAVLKALAARRIAGTLTPASLMR